LPRYLRAMKLRADRWRQNQAKDADRARNLAPYEAQLTRDPSPLPPAARDTLRWLVEELRVSLFAQELGTTEPISPVKLDRLIAAWRRGGANGAGDAGGRAGEPAPIVASPITKPEEKKAPPLKSFGALDGLFGGVRKAR
ncbi:DUF3418 domain-containing protein, partial [Geminisphaera colitermitum]|uniref:DUF3418 domain-containing protein n=1 Tax=Geminisphaera colitermitum TaxID=1148786 RepID=UPI0005B94219